MNTFFARIRRLRLRWKIAPFVVILGFFVVCLIAKRPLLEIELTRVLQRGDWLRIECVVTNLSSYEHEVFEDIQSRTLKFYLLYEDELPGWRDNELMTHSPTVNFPKFRWDQEYERVVISPGEKREMVGYLHAAYGQNYFVPTCDYSGGDSPQWKFSQWTQRSESKLSIGKSVCDKIERSIYFCFFPDRIRGKEFVPVDEVSRQLGKSLEEEVAEILASNSSPRFEFPKINKAYLNLQEFVNSDLKNFQWNHEDDPKRWEREVNWRYIRDAWRNAQDNEKEEAKEAASDFLDVTVYFGKSDRSLIADEHYHFFRKFDAAVKSVQDRETHRQINERRNHYWKLFRLGKVSEEELRGGWLELDLN
ncbi:MAG: hypothetical protein ACKVJU_20170 [Verrucomicrobiales bacterium]